jgi:hypothetical protein
VGRGRAPRGPARRAGEDEGKWVGSNHQRAEKSGDDSVRADGREKTEAEIDSYICTVLVALTKLPVRRTTRTTPATSRRQSGHGPRPFQRRPAHPAADRNELMRFGGRGGQRSASHMSECVWETVRRSEQHL